MNWHNVKPADIRTDGLPNYTRSGVLRSRKDEHGLKTLPRLDDRLGGRCMYALQNIFWQD